MDLNNRIDFAVSYAGEDVNIAKELTRRLKEKDFTVFLAEAFNHLLVGRDMESIFEKLFSEAKEVIVLISKDYKRKDWTRYEWDIIRERDPERRFIPIRVDDTKILGLPSNINYIPFKNDNYEEIIKICIQKLIVFEQQEGYSRPSEFEKILDALKNDSKGATSEAYQLVVDGRKNENLSDCKLPKGNYSPKYKTINKEWFNFSTVKRLVVNMYMPKNISSKELRFNLKHCAAVLFNECKPDAIRVYAFHEGVNKEDLIGLNSIGEVDFAPFGKWDKAQDGVAYNIPTSDYEFTVNIKI